MGFIKILRMVEYEILKIFWHSMLGEEIFTTILNSGVEEI